MHTIVNEMCDFSMEDRLAVKAKAFLNGCNLLPVSEIFTSQNNRVVLRKALL